jgi:hypothetical protein
MADPVYLLSCVKKKRLVPTPAKDLYTSDWFTKARHFVDLKGCLWFILSAEYGLVDPDQIIAPYEKTLKSMPVGERRQWAQKVIRQMDEKIPSPSCVVFLAGKRYREFLLNHLRSNNIAVEVPMQGLKIGEQLRWLNRETFENA